METNFIFIGGSFVVVVILFIFALFKFVLSNKPKEREYNIDIQDSFSIDTVRMVLDSTQSTLEDLQSAIDKLFEEYDALNPNKQEIKSILSSYLPSLTEELDSSSESLSVEELNNVQTIVKGYQKTLKR